MDTTKTEKPIASNVKEEFKRLLSMFTILFMSESLLKSVFAFIDTLNLGSIYSVW